jgi:hypothetical protein
VTATSWRGPRGAERGVGAPARAFGALLLLAMLVGAFVLWVGLPAAILWGLGELISDPTEHLVLGLVAVPLGMVLFGLLLAVLNTAYLRVTGVLPPRPDEGDDWRPRLRGPLDRIIWVSAVVCLVAFLAWLVFGSAGVAPLGP